MGLAGSGKTTLTRGLCARDAGVRAGMGIGKLGHLVPSVRSLGRLAPTWALHHRDDRWLDRREMRSIARLETWVRTLERGGAPAAETIVFDHGPLYRLARLDEFGPSVTGDPAFRRWWTGMHRYWLGALDLVVRLEAPDDVLLDRVDRRGHWYLSEEQEAAARLEFLDRYRRAFDRVLQPAGDAPAIVSCRSDRGTSEQLVERVSAAIAAGREAER